MIKNPLKLMKRVFTDQLMEDVEWVHGDTELQQISSPYFDLWSKQSGGLKKYSYFELYERLFSSYRGREVKVLEIGVHKGASIKAWREYFGDRSTIVGLDIKRGCKRFDAPESGIHVRIGDQGSHEFLRETIDEFGAFDIIMDDGSHLTHHQMESFNYLFANGLKKGGIYFIEDINTSLWRKWRTGRNDIFDLILGSVFAMNNFYRKRSCEDYSSHNYPKTFRTPLISKLIQEVRVFDSAVAIYMSDEKHYPPLLHHT